MGQMTVDGRKVTFSDEKNILEVIRSAGIDLPTFCYHSELSVYGACRMCIVEVEGRGTAASCHTPPEDGLSVRTSTTALRNIRRMALELLLANHDRDCSVCERSENCRLQELARRFGISEVRFGQRDLKEPLDTSSTGIVRDPNKCILCGDCVRICREVQSIGVLDFAHRGASVQVTPAFNKPLGDVECVTCGQCAAVCPTGALVVKSQVSEAWQAVEDDSKTVVVQIAPAVRVSLGEAFGLPDGSSVLGQIASALRRLGVDKVFDTSFTADLTVIEETHEFLKRLQHGGPLPHFTSCCPGWVTFVEQYYPDLLPHLSTCRSPQQMFGSLAKSNYAADVGVRPQDMFVISIMPCTAKKFEAQRSEFAGPAGRDVDLVLTTQELVRWIKEAGLDLAGLEPSSLDSPFGFATGAGVMFGTSGGVSEAVLRHAQTLLNEGNSAEAAPPGTLSESSDEETGIREKELTVRGQTIRIGVAQGLANARRLVEDIQAGRRSYDLVEVMACPGGCVGGAGQPLQVQRTEACEKRRAGLLQEDTRLQLRESSQNPMVTNVYRDWLEEPGSERAHEKLHTRYASRRRIDEAPMAVSGGEPGSVSVQVCVGTSCYLKGSASLVKLLSSQLEKSGLAPYVDLQAAFCCQECAGGPMLMIDDTPMAEVTADKMPDVLQRIRTNLRPRQETTVLSPK